SAHQVSIHIYPRAFVMQHRLYARARTEFAGLPELSFPKRPGRASRARRRIVERNSQDQWNHDTCPRTTATTWPHEHRGLPGSSVHRTTAAVASSMPLLSTGEDFYGVSCTSVRARAVCVVPGIDGVVHRRRAHVLKGAEVMTTFNDLPLEHLRGARIFVLIGPHRACRRQAIGRGWHAGSMKRT